MEPCASWDHLDPFSELSGFLPPSSIWVGRFFIESIVRFSSPISRLDWEVFHQTSQVRFPPIYLTSLRFSSLVSYWVRRFFTKHTQDLLVFLPRLPSGLGGFSPNTLRIFRFSSSVSHWVRRFFINQSCIFLIVPSGLGVWYLGIWFFFLTSLLVGRKFFHPFHESNTKQRWWNIRSTELAPKKEGNYNFVATWPITWSR